MTFCCQETAAQCRWCLVHPQLGASQASHATGALHLLQGCETCVSCHPTDIWANLVFASLSLVILAPC